MQEELRRNNTIGDPKGIIYFAGIVLQNENISRDSARQLCSFINEIRINFDSAVAFFEYLGFIQVSDRLLSPTEVGKKLSNQLIDGKFEEILCKACLNKLIDDDIIDITALRFDTHREKYFIQRYGFPIAAAVFRNVLIQFNALTELQDGLGSLELNELFEEIVAKNIKGERRNLSLNSLKKQLELQQIQGETAEIYVVKYEKARLVGTYGLASKVKRISDIDVTAGYDIVSFETGASTEYDRFIEVKSYIGQPHFYWSENEIEVATVFGDKYYLYLVNSDQIEECEYHPTIICNPVRQVIEEDNWLMIPKSYLVLPAGAV